MDLSLRHKYALVCGASRGIGAAIAHELAVNGASIVALARDAARLQGVLVNLPVIDGQVHEAVSLDLSNPDAIAPITAELAERPIAVLINNTGGPPPGPLHAADIDALRNGFTQHVLAAQVLTSTLLPGMRQGGYGRIINVISTSVKQPIPNLGVSNTIRGAMASWAKTLATELGPDGITVNNILPGFTATKRLASLFANTAEREGISVEQVEDRARAGIPLRRFAEPAEVAAAAAFLASPAAAYISGINLPVDGGRLQCL